jgi:hypothetical protein
MRLRRPRKLEAAKAGVSLDKCEDASWAVYSYDTSLARLAVSDGASESAFSREWAQILTHRFVSRAPVLSTFDWEGMTTWLDACGQEWSRGIPWDRIPWHGQAKTRTGAFATFLGMTLSPARNYSGAYPWQAVAVGDSCLFIVHDDFLGLSFPLDNSGQFNNTPGLVCSNPANNAQARAHLRQTSGECHSGDTILLASDAVAAWILKECESGGRPWEQLLPLESPAQWDAWVQARREERSMRNDDATLMIVQID